MNLSDMAIEILRKTNDGDDLAPRDLYLVELAVNDCLNTEGLEVFQQLYNKAMQGYQKPWHCGIEHLTKDLEGYIYWKGVKVEHYDFTNFEEEKAAAEELAARCRHLESIHVVPDTRTAIWDWSKYA